MTHDYGEYELDPSDDRSRALRELAIQARLAPALIAAGGWAAPGAERAFSRARELAELLDDRERLAGVLYGLATQREYRADHRSAQALIEERLEVQGDGAGERIESRGLLCSSLFHQGAFEEALEHADLGLAAFSGSEGSEAAAALGEEPAASCHGWAALCSWFLGERERATEHVEASLLLAREPGRGHGLAAALTAAARLHQHRGDVDAAREAATEAAAVARRRGLAYFEATATILLGWSRAAGGEAEEGVLALQRGLDAHAATGAEIDRPYFLGLLADAYGRAAQPQVGAEVADAALALIPGESGFFYEPELRRIRAALLAASADPGAVEPSLARRNVAALRPVYAQWRRGNWRPRFDVYAPDMEWGWSEEFPGLAGVSRDRERHSGRLREWLSPWEDWRCEAEEFVAAGDRVVVLCRYTGRGKGSRVAVESRGAHVWTMSDGRATRLEIFSSREKALRSAGLATGDPLAADAVRLDPQGA